MLARVNVLRRAQWAQFTLAMCGGTCLVADFRFKSEALAYVYMHRCEVCTGKHVLAFAMLPRMAATQDAAATRAEQHKLQEDPEISVA